MPPSRAVLPGSLIVLIVASSAASQTAIYPYAPPPAFESEITVTATGVESETQKIPVPTTVIDRAEIDDSQYDNVADLLRRVPGVTVMRSGDEGKVTSVFTRGTDSDQTLLMYNGVRLNSGYFGGYDWSLLTTNGVERIEVARGPFSALWGADAVGGVVNVIPAHGRQGYGLGVVLEGGQEAWRRGEVNVNLGGEHLSMFASGFYREGRSELDNSDFETRQVLVDVGYGWGTSSRLSVLFQDVKGEAGIPYVTPDDPTPERRQQNDQRLLAVPLQWQIGDKWRLELVGSKVERTFSFRDPEDPLGLTETENQADTGQARLASHHNIGSHTFSWGGEWREDEVTDVNNFGVTLDGETSTVTSVFVQDVWQAGEKLRLILGVRRDQTDDDQSETSPRINLGWRFAGETELRVSYGEAFRQPSLGELYFPISGNPDLVPETSKSFEIGLVGAPRLQRSRWQLSFFSTELDNLIQFDFPSFTNENISSATIRGAEFALESELTEEFSQLFQATYLTTEDDQGERLLRRPGWSVSYTLTGSIWNNVRGDFTVLYIGSREDIDPTTFERESVGGYTLLNLALAWQVMKSGEVTLRVPNLLDRSYAEVLGFPAPGRRLMAGIRFRF